VGTTSDDGAAHAESAGRSPKGLNRRIAIGVVVLVIVGGTSAAAVGLSAKGRQPTVTATPSVQTVAIIKTNLSDTQTLSGTLGFGTAQTVKGAESGVITELPAAGATVARGQPLYLVNNQPVALFYGITPLYRALNTVGTVGPDVEVIAANLKALGYDIGAQPSVGTVVTEASTPPVRTTVESGDGVLTTSLVAAIKRWQAAESLPATGAIAVGDVVVLSGAVRVSVLQAQLGDDATEPLMSVTPTDKVVTVPVDPTAIDSIKQGDQVSVTLPDNSTATGTVSNISTAVQNSTDDAGADSAGSGLSTPTINVTVTLDNPSAVADLDSATVQVQFTAATADGVLALPVQALLALSGGGYAVQLKSGGLVRVQTGMFAMGMVAVTGAGLEVGTQVVTAQ